MTLYDRAWHQLMQKIHYLLISSLYLFSDSSHHGSLRFRQLPTEYAPFGAFFISTHQFTQHTPTSCFAGGFHPHPLRSVLLKRQVVLVLSLELSNI